MAFFKGVGDEQVTFAPERTGGISSLWGTVRRFANKVQGGHYGQQQVYNLKKLVSKPQKSENFLEEAEAEAPEADWWSGGKESGQQLPGDFQRSSSEEALLESSDEISEDEIRVAGDDIAESHSAQLEDAPQRKPPMPGLPAPSASATDGKPLLTLEEPEPERAAAAAAAQDPPAGTKKKAKDGGKAKGEKLGSANGVAEETAKATVKGAARSKGETEEKAKAVVKDRAEKTADTGRRSVKEKVGEDKEKKPKKEKKEKKEKKAKKEGKAPKAPPAARARDPFADSDSEGFGRKAPAAGGAGGSGSSKPPQPPAKARDPFADSDSDDGGEAATFKPIQSAAAGRRPPPGRKPAPARNPFADSDDDLDTRVRAQSRPVARTAGSVSLGSKGKGAPTPMPKSLQRPLQPQAADGRQHWPATADSDSDPGF